jgi:uncharacterized cupredoxin-like copper-binding protein
MKHPITAALLAAALVATFAGPAFAHGDAARSGRTEVVKEQKDWGIAGEAKNAKRTLNFTMGDDMRFLPAQVQVREGETVRIVVKNAGRAMHEFVLGTPAELAEHAALMKKHPNMEHDEPYMVHVAPGRTGSIVWTFNRAGSFDFACLIPGHFDAGMKGIVIVAPR